MADDYFLEINDCNGSFDDAAEDEVQDTNFPIPKSFKFLEDFMEREDFNNPIRIPVNKNLGEIIIMIIKYSLTHSISLTGITDLFKLINCIFAEPILRETRYLIDKLFYPKSCAKLHAICSKCGAYSGTFNRQDDYLKCKACKTEIDVKNYHQKDFFITMDASSQILKLIESNPEYYDYIMNEREHEKGLIKDIFDGKRYRDFRNSLSESDKHQYVTVTFNTDGAPLFKSSTQSIWPIFLMVNELPFDVKSKELILAGLWFGKDKPNMNAFLNPFVEDLNKMSHKGIKCILKGLETKIKVFPLVCCVDSVARAPMQEFVQFNGSYGCGHCLHPGKWVKNNSNNSWSGSIKYPLLNLKKGS